MNKIMLNNMLNELSKYRHSDRESVYYDDVAQRLEEVYRTNQKEIDQGISYLSRCKPLTVLKKLNRMNREQVNKRH